jgi:5-formyltetrahydrofolate cyclo-ligase
MISKIDLRSEAHTRRTALARANPDFARRIAEHVNALNVRDGSVIGAYVAMKDEADPFPLLETLIAKQCVIALPRVVAKDEPLAFHRWKPGDELYRGALGISEPAKDTPLAFPHILLAPLLAFDARGHRLGYGGGFYDRTLDFLRANSTVRAIGVAYAGQEVAELPREDHDHVLDAIITENGVREFHHT